MRHLCDDASSAILLTGFASAVPSLSQAWLFHVLEVMELPAFVVRFCRMMHDANVAIIAAGGESFHIVSIEAGAKQGCPASMPPFSR
eukprot:5492851-Pyramimonas_sp.AAC.2